MLITVISITNINVACSSGGGGSERICHDHITERFNTKSPRGGVYQIGTLSLWETLCSNMFDVVRFYRARK